MIPSIELGEKIGEGAEMVVFVCKNYPEKVVKVPKDRPDMKTVFTEQMQGLHILHNAGLTMHQLDTQILIPGIIDEKRYPFLAIQTRCATTLFDDLCLDLNHDDIVGALSILEKFFEFEAHILWQSGVVIQDAGNILCNITLHENRLKLLDFSSLTDQFRALNKMIERNKADLRIRLLLKKLADSVGPVKEWNTFEDQVWQMSHQHYTLTRMQKYWPVSGQ